MSPVPVRYRLNGDWATGLLTDTEWHPDEGPREVMVLDDESGEYVFTHEFARIEVGHA